MSFQTFFHNPPTTYRLAPFWFWNGKMEPEEIVHQIREMAEKGVGGFFICARQGLEVPYLSEQWFRLVAIAIEAAQQYRLDAWLYDEYPYPSGMSGGEVILQHPEARHCQLLPHSLTIEGPQTLSYELPWARVLSAHAVPLNTDRNALTNSENTIVETQFIASMGPASTVPSAIDLSPYIGSAPAQSIFQSTGLTKYTHKRFFTASLQKQLV